MSAAVRAGVRHTAAYRDTWSLTATFSAFERRTLDSPALYARLTGALAIIWLLARAITSMQARGADSQPQFEEEPGDRLVSLDVWDHRFTPGVKERLP